MAINTYHTDIGAFALAGKYITGEGKWLSFYDSIASKNSTGMLVVHRDDMVFNYQPLAYLIPSTVYLPFKGIIDQTGELLLNKQWISHQPISIRFILLIYKLPMILADVAILYLLPKFFIAARHQTIATILWAYNPLAIFVSSMMGQVDIIIALLLLTSYYYLQKKHVYLSAALIALSALFKPIGLILLPVVAIYHFHYKNKLSLLVSTCVIGFITYLIGVSPYVQSGSYRHYALFAEQLSKSTYASISIASGHDIPLFFILYTIVLLLYWSRKITVLDATISILLASLAFTHFHPQWMVWVIPLFLIRAILTSEYMSVGLITICWLLVLFSFDESLNTQLFINSTLTISSAIKLHPIFVTLISLARAGIVGCLVFLITSPSIVHPKGQKKSITDQMAYGYGK